MNPTAFLLSLGVAIAAPLLVLHYLVPALRRAAASASCDAAEGLDFWLAALRWLAVLGTLMLVLSFGEFRDGADLLAVLRRTLWLVAAGLFASVALMARVVWNTIRERALKLERQQLLLQQRTPPAAHTASVRPATAHAGEA